ncbi:MAG: hypothetical protein U9R68_03455, partial [Planctomycetota bacterium]|nr:hypothetical protein [Planctomycetota bacterium]
MPRLTSSLAAGALMLAAIVGQAWAAERETPWPVPVEGFKAPAPGEHPRLLFRRGDLARLKARARTPEGQAILRRLRVCLNGGDGESMPSVKSVMTTAYGKTGGPKPQKSECPVGTYSISHAAGFGFLYHLTGQKKYADLGRECFEWAFAGVRDRDREARYSFRQPGGALRAGPSLGWYAVGYDLCYDGWDEAYRRKVAEAILNYNEGKDCSLAELARGARHMPASNHWGMQVGGAALALLAIMNDPGVDMKQVAPLLQQSEKAMIRNMTEGFGDHGWFPEGDGTGSMSSQIAFIPALQAWRTAGGLDYITPRPNAPWMTLKWIFLTVPRGGKMDFPSRGAYPHNVWDRDGISGAGYFCEGFGGVTAAQKPALLWFYNHHLRKADEAAGTPLDTPSPYPHHAVLTLVNWPFGMKEQNPAECLPRATGDTKYGFYMFRNRWKDASDIVISVQTNSTRGWHKANTTGAVEVWGLGKKTRWGNLRNGLTYFRPAADG